MRGLTGVSSLLLVAGLVAAPLGSRSAVAEKAGERYAFRNVTTEMGVYQSTRTWGSSWTDYDSDGDPDLFVSRHWRTPRMFLNTGDGFRRLRRQTELQGTHMDRHICVWGEANHDGDPDLFCTQGADKGLGSGPKQLLINKDGNLIDEAKRWGLKDPKSRGRTATWIDFDGDLDLDLFSGGTYREGYPNQMFRRIGNRFERARVGVDDHLSTVSSSWADWDRDGDPDLLALQHYPFRPVLYKNGGGTFSKIHIELISSRSWTSSAFADYDGDGFVDLHLASRSHSLILRNTGHGFKPVKRSKLRQGRMSVWFDVENDGDLDLFVVQGARGDYPSKDSVNRPDFLLVNDDGRFHKVTSSVLRGPRAGNGDAVSAADFDRDGRVDLFVTNGIYHFSGPNELLQNTSQAGNWIGIDLAGTNENPLGIGARVLVGAGALTYWRDVTDNVNFRTQSEIGYVHLGIGNATTATINVRWPDGTLDCVTLPANTIFTVQHKTLPCA
jgi:hypothetical protein